MADAAKPPFGGESVNPAAAGTVVSSVPSVSESKVSVAPVQTGIWGLVERFAAYKQRLNLPSPGSWEGLHREAKMTQPTNFMIEGAKFDFTSILSQNFQVMHSFSWGSAQYPPSYQFGSMYAQGKLMMHGQVDDNGGLQARCHYNWMNPVLNPQPAFDPTKPPHEQPPPQAPEGAKQGSTTKVTAHMSGQPGQNMVQIEQDHVGSDYSLTVKAVNPNPISKGPSWALRKGGSALTGVYQIGYLQSILPSLALGGEFMYQRVLPESEESSLTFAMRYAPAPTPVPPPTTLPAGMPSPFPPVDPKAPTQIFTTTFSPSTGLLHSSYWRRLNQRLEVFSELQLLLTKASVMGPGQREGIANVGFKLDTINSTIRGMVDTTGRLAAVLEERIAGGLSFQMSGELDYAKGGGGVGRVGLGFTFEA
ncbi:eukaryotic porin-domain-containing protein [Gaertneriomyces semiglobifer]|nr:eukaryotic porin-domain-containing protein [Gaertneriomyces semiglobifer]